VQRVAARIERDLGTSGPLFGVHPGNKQSAYNWPPARYGELAARLSAHGRVMVTGSPAEEPLLLRIRSGLSNTARGRVAFYSHFDLDELSSAISLQAALTVSSTGPMHLAGALGTPIVALFSPHPAHAPAKWAPLGDRHTILIPPLAPGESAMIPPERADEVMSRIGVEQVVEANLNYAAALGHGPLPSAASIDRKSPGQAA
jgi:ADP-heptose:LPS heptosyltransferase